MGEPDVVDELVRVSTKVRDWLERLADASEARGRDLKASLPALAEANEADAKNYRETARALTVALEPF